MLGLLKPSCPFRVPIEQESISGERQGSDRGEWKGLKASFPSLLSSPCFCDDKLQLCINSKVHIKNRNPPASLSPTRFGDHFVPLTGEDPCVQTKQKKYCHWPWLCKKDAGSIEHHSESPFWPVVVSWGPFSYSSTGIHCRERRTGILGDFGTGVRHVKEQGRT